MSFGHVAVVGGGFSGALQAINLLRHGNTRVTLIERRPHLARGVAYSAAHACHLLNVRAGNMSALPDDPGHFVRWLEARGAGDAATFAPRRSYGAYLGELLDDAIATAGNRLTIMRDDAVDLIDGDAGVAIRLAGGGTVTADAAVLAIGNLPPHAPPGLDPDAIDPDHYVADPWVGEVGRDLTDDDTVLLIGTGLTAIDVALMLDDAGFRGRIVAMSRRGLAPRGHAAGAPEKRADPPPTRASALVRAVRARADAVGWRAAVDELRPHTQAMWRTASVEERGRFLRHLRPWWDVHRHRIAPTIAARIDAMCARGTLRFVAGKPDAFEDGADGVRVAWRPRGTDRIEALRVRRIVNCTGPQGDLRRATEPLLMRLLERGTIRPDACRLGLDVDARAQLVDSAGRAHRRLFAVGPMTRAAFWEIVAVPDIRHQVQALARQMSEAVENNKETQIV